MEANFSKMWMKTNEMHSESYLLVLWAAADTGHFRREHEDLDSLGDYKKPGPKRSEVQNLKGHQIKIKNNPWWIK